jgi:uncharacterized protein (TIGR00251 family)
MIALFVKVKPGSSKDEISFDKEGKLVIKIKERPIEGAANVYLIKFMAKEFELRKSEITLEKGSGSPFKKILLDIDPNQLERILNKYK